MRTIHFVSAFCLTASIGAVADDAAQYKKLVAAIQKADYRAERATLERLFRESEPYLHKDVDPSRVRYWRGFALWRRAINGFNETPQPTDLESDLQRAIQEFQASFSADPKFVDAKFAELSCYGFTMFLHMGDTDRVKEMMPAAIKLMKECRDLDNDHPRLAWVMGPNVYNTPKERGGGPDTAIALYTTALAAMPGAKKKATSPLDPTWGEAELHMSLAWTYQNKPEPDLALAEKHARLALKRVPDWHYVKKILLPSILKARASR